MKWWRGKELTRSEDQFGKIVYSGGFIRFPIYLNEWKIRTLFDQCLPGLTAFAETHAREKGISVKSSLNLGNMLALFGIKTEVGSDLSRKDVTSKEVRIETTPMVQLFLLEKYLEKKGLIVALPGFSENKNLPFCSIVKAKGRSMLIWGAKKNLKEQLGTLSPEHWMEGPETSQSAALAIEAQRKHEEEIEQEIHVIYLQKQPSLVTAILSRKFTTHSAFRQILDVFDSTILGRTLGYKAGVLFLDPVVIWVETPESSGYDERSKRYSENLKRTRGIVLNDK